MQIKVRTRCKNPTCKMYTTCPECKGTGWEEGGWESADVIFSELNERIDALGEMVVDLQAAIALETGRSAMNCERIERLEDAVGQLLEPTSIAEEFNAS